jgi:signal transduction histidine kinase
MMTVNAMLPATVFGMTARPAGSTPARLDTVRLASVPLASVRRELGAFLRARPVLTDSLFAVALLGVFSASMTQLPSTLWPATMSAMIGWNAIGTAFVAIRRRWTWIAVVALSVHAVFSVTLGVPTGGLAILVITFTAAAHLPVRQSASALILLWLPSMIAANVLHRYTVPPAELNSITAILLDTMMALVAYLTGRVVFTRRRYVAALVERARTAEQNQQALATQAVEDERRRIARELHDMVAHHVSVMGVLATGARRLLVKDPDTADEALATIEKTSRTALREMRRLLDVLRTEPDRAAEPAQPLAPQPGLAALAGLAEQVREAGVAVAVRTSGEPETLDPGVGLTVYRIVQEALTNVLKHGGTRATAEVRLDFGRYWLTVEVFDTGRGAANQAACPTAGQSVGHGLVGMRERVALFGGVLRTGPRPGGGFRVYARIPIEEVGTR